MDKSKVYYTNFHTTFSENLPQKLKRLIKTAGMEQIDFQNKYAAIKISVPTTQRSSQTWFVKTAENRF